MLVRAVVVACLAGPWVAGAQQPARECPTLTKLPAKTPDPGTVAYADRIVNRADSAIYAVRDVLRGGAPLIGMATRTPGDKAFMSAALDAEDAAKRVSRLQADLDIEPPPTRYTALHPHLLDALDTARRTVATYGAAAEGCFERSLLQRQCESDLTTATGLAGRAIALYDAERFRVGCLMDAEGVSLRPRREDP